MKSKNNLLYSVREYRKSAKYYLTLNIELKEIIIGLLLGDLFAEKRNINSNTRLQFKQSVKNKTYINHLYSLPPGLFEVYCSTPLASRQK
jgi:LAGLIDADG DNA endonuclease family